MSQLPRILYIRSLGSSVIRRMIILMEYLIDNKMSIKAGSNNTCTLIKVKYLVKGLKMAGGAH